MHIWRKLLSPPAYLRKAVKVRKWLGSLLAHEHLSASLFGKLYFKNKHRTWRNTYWMGVPVLKLPLDLWIYQEILCELRPSVIVECGTRHGGSALFLAHMCDLLGSGRVLTVDIKRYAGQPQHPRICYILGSSIDDAVVAQVKAHIAPGERVMVVLDSEHCKAHVARELELYGALVTPESYMIVEDTYLNGHPVDVEYGPGPMEALQEYLVHHPEFVSDTAREKFFVTWNPSGYLKRVK